MKNKNIEVIIKNRTLFFLLFIIVCFFIIIVRIGYLQLFNTKASIKNLNDLSVKKVYGPSMPRGRILDKNHNVIVDNVGTNLISYKKDNKDYFITKYNYVYEGIITDRCNKIYIQIIDNTLNDKIFNDLLSIIDSSYTLEDIYNKLNYYTNIKIIKSKLIDNKTNELITDKLVIKNNSLEDLKLTINNQDKEYIIEKNNDNYIVTYINSSLEDINKSYFTINNSTSFVKKLERKKSF